MENKSLGEVNQSVDTTTRTGWKRILAFLGPAYMISVGYMDPGNWATDIAGGSRFGYSLIWVLLMSNIIALLLQSHCARLGIVTGKDLAQVSRETYPPYINFSLYILAEIAIAACDLAEVVGMAIGLNLLFKIPLLVAVCITVVDTFLLLFLLNFGIRKLEAFIIALISLIGLSFVAEMFFAQPEMSELAKGLIPSIPSEDALYIAIGIIGATVMPHNLYLHSSLVQSRKIDRSDNGIKKAIRYNFIDSAIALNLAFFVNCAILVLAAASFYKNGLFDVQEIEDAHKFLEPMLGNALAPALFAIALIAAGQSSTITGTLSGQIIMEGYLNLRIRPWVRRLLTRLLAIGPAFAAILIMGPGATGKLLILSQVILSLQLGFAIIPLIHFVSNKNRMGIFAIGTFWKIISWLAAIIIVGLNLKYVAESLFELAATNANGILILTLLTPIVLYFLWLLAYISFKPFFSVLKQQNFVAHEEATNFILETTGNPNCIAIALDFSAADNKAINAALQFGKTNVHYYLIHIVETPGAWLYGKEARDLESETDQAHLDKLCEEINKHGFHCTGKLGYGNPRKIIPAMVSEVKADFLVMGSHGHKVIKDFILGTTIDAVRHKVGIPVMVI